MQAAKDSVKKVLSKSGQHDTTIHENTAPAVQHETIAQTQHEREQMAVDREVHQDHYHTTEQPVSHGETLQEQHHHREMPMEKREFHHGNDEETHRHLADQQAKYQSSQTRVEGDKTRSTEAAATGEHVHHHVHETIQPVVHKQTVEPHVVHTTVPVHEVHHNEAQHHATSSLQGVSMDDFKNKGGSLQGSGERSDFFPGQPKKFEGEGHHGGMGLTGGGANPRQHDMEHGNEGALRHGGESTLRSGNESNLQQSNMGRDNVDSTTGSSNTKPSLMDKLNPKKDATGDGVAGFMK